MEYAKYEKYTVSQNVFDYNLNSKRPIVIIFGTVIDYRSSKGSFTFPLHLFCATALPWEFVEPENSKI